jgi:cytochrome b561
MVVKKNTQNDFRTILTYGKDILYILALLVAVVGWLMSKSKNEAILETTVMHNTETIKKIETFMDGQSTLNGKIIQYMETK